MSRNQRAFSSVASPCGLPTWTEGVMVAGGVCMALFELEYMRASMYASACKHVRMQACKHVSMHACQRVNT